MATNSERLDLAEAALRDALSQLSIYGVQRENIDNRMDQLESMIVELTERVEAIETG